MKKIPLTQGQFALVDDDDFRELSRHKWQARKRKNTWYAERTIYATNNSKSIFMHQQIMDSKDGGLTDHKDSNGLNNQRSNLRSCTYAQNAQNRKRREDNVSGYKGVCWHKCTNKWSVQIGVGGVRLHLGLFFCLIKAAKAYDTAARKHFGEFARTNFALAPVPE